MPRESCYSPALHLRTVGNSWLVHSWDTLGRKARLSPGIPERAYVVTGRLFFLRHWPSFDLSLHSHTLSSAPPLSLPSLFLIQRFSPGLSCGLCRFSKVTARPLQDKLHLTHTVMGFLRGLVGNLDCLWDVLFLEIISFHSTRRQLARERNFIKK